MNKGFLSNGVKNNELFRNSFYLNAVTGVTSRLPLYRTLLCQGTLRGKEIIREVNS